MPASIRFIPIDNLNKFRLVVQEARPVPGFVTLCPARGVPPERRGNFGLNQLPSPLDQRQIKLERKCHLGLAWRARRADRAPLPD